MPVVASGDMLVYLDPESKVAPTPVHFEQLESESSDNIGRNPFDFLPEEFAIRNGHCEGSLFCLPLRKEPSELSKTVYTEQRLKELIAMFAQEGNLNILFLRNVTCIKIYQNSINGMSLLYSARKNERFYEQKKQYEEKKKENILNECFQQIIKVNNVIEISEESTTVGPWTSHANYTYFVSEQFGLEATENNIFLDDDLNYLPSLSIAYPIKGDDPGGHVFCGLPLPLQEKRMTGLPIHVQGYFALGEDRKDLIWDSSTVSKRNKNAMWN